MKRIRTIRKKVYKTGLLSVADEKAGEIKDDTEGWVSRTQQNKIEKSKGTAIFIA